MNRCRRNCWNNYCSYDERKNNMNNNKNASNHCCCCCCKYEEKYNSQSEKCGCQEREPKCGCQYGLEYGNQEYDSYNSNFECNNYYREY